MQGVIQRLCRDIWLTPNVLGELLQRNSDGLRSRFLTPMVDAGVLVPRYLKTPNRPDQAYRTATASDSQSGPP